MYMYVYAIYKITTYFSIVIVIRYNHRCMPLMDQTSLAPNAAQLCLECTHLHSPDIGLPYIHVHTLRAYGQARYSIIKALAMVA